MRAGLFFVLAPSWYLLTEAVSASAFDGYNYATFYISDLGVPSFGEFDGRSLASHLPQVMNAGFIGAGLLMLLGLATLAPQLPRRGAAAWMTAFGVLHAVGITFVGLVPGSPENAANGRILIHGLGAVAAIAGGNLAAIASARALAGTSAHRVLRILGPALGTTGLLSGLALSLHRLFPDGVWERGAVYAFMAWELALGVTLLRGFARRTVTQRFRGERHRSRVVCWIAKAGNRRRDA